LKRIVKY